MSYSEFTRWPFMKWEVGYWDIWLMLLFSARKHMISFHFIYKFLWTCCIFPSILLRPLLFPCTVIWKRSTKTFLLSCALFELYAKLAFYLYVCNYCKTSHNGHCSCTSHITLSSGQIRWNIFTKCACSSSHPAHILLFLREMWVVLSCAKLNIIMLVVARVLLCHF